MDQEIFPNPVVRNDLPVRRRRWPRILIALGVLAAVFLVFLPQFLGTAVGRKFAVSFIASKTRSAVVLEGIKTSWFRGTTIQKLIIKDAHGRRMGFDSLTCQASLLDLLRENYALGNAEIRGLYADYVVNDGRGGDSFSAMRKPPTSPAEAMKMAAERRVLPKISGNIKIVDGAITFWRGTVQPKLYDVVFQGGRFGDIDAEFKIQSLDKPWTYTLTAESAEDGYPSGTITSSGTVCLGAAGRYEETEVKLDLKVEGKNVRTAPLGVILVPASLPEDIRQAVGEAFTTVDLVVKGADGRIVFEKFDLVGPDAQLHLHPAIELTGSQRVTLAGGSNQLSMGVSKRLASGVLSYLNPFFREAVGGKGRLKLSLEELSIPTLQNQWITMTGKGALSAKGVTLARFDEMTAADALPSNLASQLALITGDDQKTVEMDADGRFAIGEGKIAVPPMSNRLDGVQLNVEGTTDLQSGELATVMTVVPSEAVSRAVPSLAGASFAVPLTGSVNQPWLNVLAPRGSLTEAAIKDLSNQVRAQVSKMRSKEMERLMQKSQQQVKDLLKPLQGSEPAPKYRD